MVATPTATYSRLPGGHDPRGSRAGEVVRGLLALIAIAVFAIGVPVSLWLGFGSPWPDQAPNADWLYADFDARDVLAVLVGVVWIGWAHFLLCLIVEFFAERKGRGLSPRVPGGAIGTQPVARRLVGAVLLLAGGMAVTVPTATALTTYETDQARATSVAQPAQDAGVVGKAATTADRTSGHGGATNAAFTDQKAGVLHKFVEVQPPEGRNYDTLWGIAERYLGDGLRYKEVAALNQGVVQPDGTTLQNPDLIYPGWILKLPADAEGPGLRTPDHDPTTSRPDGPRNVGDEQDPGSGPDTPVSDGADAAVSGADGSGATALDDASLVSVGGFSTVGALLAAGLFFQLRRRRGWDGGPHPRGGKPLDQEFDLRNASDESSSVFVDTILRGLAAATPAGASLPAPTAGLLGVDGLALTFPADSRVRLDPPWRGDPGGRTWSVQRSQASSVTVPRGQLSPLPGLVALGLGAHDVQTMIDIESVSGIVSVSGDLGVARDVAIGLGLGLATNRWSDRPRVTFVGFADDLSSLAPDSIRHYDDLAAVFEIVDASRRRQHSACAAGGFDSVRAARLVDNDARMWAPEFVVLSGVPSEPDVQRLQELTRDPRNATGVIVVGDVPAAPVRLVTSSDGRLWCGPMGIDVAAHRISSESYRDALSVFDAQLARSTEGQAHDAAAVSAPIVDPDALDLSQPMPVQVTTLGQVAVDAPGDVDEARRPLLTELIVYLALHPEGIHPNVLAAAIWPRGVSDVVRDSVLAQAAQWLGVDDSATPRLRIDAEGRWVLAPGGVRVDWDVFRVLANRAASGKDPVADLELALTLAKDAAWSGIPAGRYGWLAYETIEADVRVAVVAVARRLASLSAEAGAPLGARNALQAALRLAPACEEVWRDALHLTSKFAGRADVRAVADDMYAAIAQYGSPRGAEAETDALVDELVPGYRRSSAA